MKTFSNYLIAALMGTALISSCSRPVAYFQPTARQQYKSVQTEAVAVTPAEATQPVAVETSAPQVAVVAQTATPTEQIAQAKQAVSQVEAYVRNDNKLASNKKLTKRLARVNELLATTSPKEASSMKATASKKAPLLQRMVLKHMDKKIKNQLAPERTMAKSLLTIGVIVAVIGLVLLLVGTGGLATLGYIALLVGLVLVLVDLLR